MAPESAESHDHRHPSWVRGAVFYQIFPDRFARSVQAPRLASLEPWDAPPTLHGYKGGDLDGVRERLDYLVDLGVTALYFNPIFASTANHRYHTYDYHAVDPILGGTPAFRRLLDEAHRRGLRVILDGVFNHASRGFYQFNQTLENGLASPYVDWFHFNEAWLREGRTLNAYPQESARLYDAPSHEASLERFGYRAWWDLPALPKFNTRSPEVREFLFGVAEHWLRFGIDGWRLDVPAEIDDDDFWREFRRRVRGINAEAYIVGEIWHDARRWLAGDQFDGVTNYLFGQAAIGFCLGETLNRDELQRCGLRETRALSAADCAKALTDLCALYPRAILDCQLNTVGSHDTPRLLTMGSGDVDGVKLVYAMMFMFPGAPCIYYGDEIGMAGGHDPDCRRGFEWDERLWNADLRAYIKRLASLKREHDALRHGDFRVLRTIDGCLVLERRGAGESILCVINVSRQEQVVAMPWAETGLQVLSELGGRPRDLSPVGEGVMALRVPVRSARFLRSGA